jgi:hypothetical protein
METVFKVGDKVYCCLHGHGVVKSVNYTESYPLFVDFGYDTNNYTFDGKLYDYCKPTLSFTEYTLQGFSQERQIVLPEVGEVCLVKDSESDGYLVREFAEYRDGLFICVAFNRQGYKEWKYIKRIKILD